MTTWLIIPRWVSARCGLGRTRILESLMISIQIIIELALEFPPAQPVSHYTLEKDS